MTERRHIRDRNDDTEYGFCNAEVKSNERLSTEELELTKDNLLAITDNLGKGYALSRLEYEVILAAWHILCDLEATSQFPRLCEKLPTGGVKKYSYGNF